MPVVLILPFILLFPVHPTLLAATAGDWQVLVPRLPDGYAAGQVAVRVRTVPIPPASAAHLVDGLAVRTGVAVTAAHGVRLEVALPADVHFTSLRAQVADGLVVEPEQRGFVGKVGGAVLSVLRLLLFGHLVSAADELAIPGTAWAMALGAPNPHEEMVRLTTGEELYVERGQKSFSDHGDFVVCRAMLALTPWTELVQVHVEGFDQVSGKNVSFQIPRIRIDGDPATEPTPGPIARETRVASVD